MRSLGKVLSVNIKKIFQTIHKSTKNQIKKYQENQRKINYQIMKCILLNALGIIAEGRYHYNARLIKAQLLNFAFSVGSQTFNHNHVNHKNRIIYSNILRGNISLLSLEGHYVYLHQKKEFQISLGSLPNFASRIKRI